MSRGCLIKASLMVIAAFMLVLALAACSMNEVGTIPSAPTATRPAATTFSAGSSPAPVPTPGQGAASGTSTPAAPSLAAPTPAEVKPAAPAASASGPSSVIIPAGKPAGTFKSLLIEAQVNGDTVTISLDSIVKSTNTRFKLSLPEGQEMFMAYIWDGKVQVRASICPPCRGQSFTLTRGTLVCDTCGTVFDAATGKGISGACVAYPKQSAQYRIDGNNLVLSENALITAYKNTLNRSS